MQLEDVPVTTFARFYEATNAQKVRVVRDSRLNASDPKGYVARDYYMDFRNTLKQTHWATNDISKFEAALDSLVMRQTIPGRGDHYRKLGEAYISYWKKRDAQFFPVDHEVVAVAGLNIRVSAEVGMHYDGNDLALKLSLTAPKPTRPFRQVIQFLSKQAFERNPTMQPAIWDVRREEVLQPIPIPKDFLISLEGAAGAFRQMWESLDQVSPSE